jgi:hypothetical protein
MVRYEKSSSSRVANHCFIFLFHWFIFLFHWFIFLFQWFSDVALLLQMLQYPVQMAALCYL